MMTAPPMILITLWWAPCAVARITTPSRAPVASNSSPSSEIETNRESHDTHHTRESPCDPGFVAVVVAQQPTHYEGHRRVVWVQHEHEPGIPLSRQPKPDAVAGPKAPALPGPEGLAPPNLGE